jgi:hypothetical protein
MRGRSIHQLRRNSSTVEAQEAVEKKNEKEMMIMMRRRMRNRIEKRIPDWYPTRVLSYAEKLCLLGCYAVWLL